MGNTIGNRKGTESGSGEGVEGQTLLGSSTSTITTFKNDKKYDNLDEILIAYGAYHPKYRQIILYHSLVFAVVTINLYYIYFLHFLGVHRRIGHMSCPCNETFVDIKQKILIKNHGELAKNMGNILFWGIVGSLVILSLSQRTGRVKSIGICLIFSFISGVLLAIQIPVYGTIVQYTCVFIKAMTYLNISVLVFISLLESIPSPTRAMGLFMLFATTVVAHLIVHLLTFYIDHMEIICCFISIPALPAGVLVLWKFHESPYYYLSKYDAESLQGLFEAMETTDNSLNPEKLIDDVAFERYENTETTLDALWKAFSNWHLAKEVIIIIIAIGCSWRVRDHISNFQMSDYRCVPFASLLLDTGYQFIGYLFGLLFTRPSRAFAPQICMLLLAVSFVATMPICPWKVNICIEKYTRLEGASAVYEGLLGLTMVFFYAFETTALLDVAELTPTVVRGFIVGLSLFLASVFKQGLSELASEITYKASLTAIGPFGWCLFGGVLLFLSRRNHPSPMAAFFIDLEREDIDGSLSTNESSSNIYIPLSKADTNPTSSSTLTGTPITPIMQAN